MSEITIATDKLVELVIESIPSFNNGQILLMLSALQKSYEELESWENDTKITSLPLTIGSGRYSYQGLLVVGYSHMHIVLPDKRVGIPITAQKLLEIMNKQKESIPSITWLRRFVVSSTDKVGNGWSLWTAYSKKKGYMLYLWPSKEDHKKYGYIGEMCISFEPLSDALYVHNVMHN